MARPGVVESAEAWLAEEDLTTTSGVLAALRMLVGGAYLIGLYGPDEGDPPQKRVENQEVHQLVLRRLLMLLVPEAVKADETSRGVAR